MQRCAMIMLALIGFFLQTAGQNTVIYKVNYKLQIQKDLKDQTYFLVHRNKKLIMQYYDTECNCFHVQFKDIYGIVLTENWLNDAYWYPIRKQHRADTALAEKAHQFLIDNIAKLPVKRPLPEQENARRLKLIKQYGYNNGINIADGYLWLGMTDKMVLDSWGIPYQVKRTIANFHITEMWIYSGVYLFFENGVLTEVFKINHQ